MTTNQTIKELINKKFDPISQKINELSEKVDTINIPTEIYEKIILSAMDVRNLYCGQVGSCFISSREIGDEIKKLGIDYDIVRGKFMCGSLPPEDPWIPKYRRPTRHHVWIEFPQYNNIILDTSADQFGTFPTIWFPADKKCYKKKNIKLVSK